MADKILMNDKINLRDSIGADGLWARTEVIGGYGDVYQLPNGKSTLGEIIFRKKNIVTLGGVDYVMQNVFHASEDSIGDVPTLYDQEGIGRANVSPSTEYISPDVEENDSNEKVRITKRVPGDYVQLFGLGITSTKENELDVYSCDYRENTINISYTLSTGDVVTGRMVPLRYTAETLTDDERKKYFGKKTETLEDGSTVIGYYLKKFENEPIIKHVWNTGADVDDETELTSTDVWTQTEANNGVESFTEMLLKVGKKDLKEYSEAIGSVGRPRFNTIALYSGLYVKNDTVDDGDFANVKLFSKLCIPLEYVELNKDLNIIYRVYGK